MDDVDAKREALYASLLRYWPETGSLRDRALDATVAAALLGSVEDDPYRVGRIQQNIRPATLRLLRPEVVKAAANRLVAAGEAHRTTLATRHAYYLDPRTVEHLTSRAADGQSLLDRAAERTFHNTDHFISGSDARQLFRRFVSECFATFGRRIAKTVTGHETTNALPMLAEATDAVQRACDYCRCQGNALESVRTRCLEFLRSSHPEDASLRMYLTQSYYVAELLGVDTGGFSPIADDAFRGATFYLDTNVVVPRLLGTAEAPLFDELVEICKRLGIELRITRATIDEARRVAADRRNQLTEVCAKIPEELADLSDDDFLREFMERRRSDATLTVDVFLAPFDSIMEVLKGVELDDCIASEVLNDGAHAQARKAIEESAKKSHGYGKAGARLDHDVMHHVLVLRERQHNVRTWFLTRDHAMISASERLRFGEQAPSSFLFKGFLQSISPFVTTSDSDVLARYFSAAIEEDVCPPLATTLFDLRELEMIAQYHEDVLAASPADLVMAFERVKREVLKGAPYRRGSLALVALELKKYLAASADKKLTEVMSQRRAEADRAETAERELRLSDALLEASRRATYDAEQERANQAALAMQYKAAAARERQHTRMLVAGLAIVGSFVTPHVSQASSQAVVAALGSTVRVGLVAEGADVISALVALLITAWWLRGSSQSSAVRSVILAGYATAAVCNASVLANAPWERLSGIMAMFTFVAALALDGRWRKSSEGKAE